MFQSYALWPHMPRLLRMWRSDSRFAGFPPVDRRKRVQEALASVHMSEYAERKPGQLSGGQQQRVGACSGVVVKPDVAPLLLDEPLSNLDASLRTRCGASSVGFAERPVSQAFTSLMTKKRL